MIVSIILFGCTGATELPTPQKIGEKKRLHTISGKQAAQVVDRMHGRSVATDVNIIAEYGRGEKKDLLYISRYPDSQMAKEAYDLMIEKMATSKNSPFYHLMPLGKYHKKASMSLGMGAVHYIYHSGNNLLWLQTYQSFGTTLPAQLLELYPI